MIEKGQMEEVLPKEQIYAMVLILTGNVFNAFLKAHYGFGSGKIQEKMNTNDLSTVQDQEASETKCFPGKGRCFVL